MQIYCKYDELVNPKELKAHPKNRNKHSKDQIDRLAKLYEYHGVRHPIIVSKLSGYIVAGHGRIDAAKKAKLKEFPVVYQDFESDEAEYAFIQADNAIASWSELDLSAINLDLQDLGPDFDIDMLGIKDFVLEPTEKFEAQTDEDEVPEVVHPITRRGDIWLLGNHRLMCGDSTMIDDVEKLMNGDKADMVFTDPPYGAGFEIKNDKKNEFKEVFDKSITNAAIFCDNVFLIACYYSCIAEFINKMIELNFIFNEKIVWIKNLFGLGKIFHRKHEDILFFSKGNHSKDFRNKHDDVIQIDSVRNFMGSKNAKEAVGHPTQKPTELINYVIKPFLTDTSIILDPFLGSGSTIIAAEKVNKKCHGMELDEKYCDVIINRWQNYTGKKATLELSGQTYEELKVLRGDK